MSDDKTQRTGIFADIAAYSPDDEETLSTVAHTCEIERLYSRLERQTTEIERLRGLLRRRANERNALIPKAERLEQYLYNNNDEPAAVYVHKNLLAPMLKACALDEEAIQ